MPSPLLRIQVPSGRPFADGVSIVLCCHNSRERLTETLQALAEQRTTTAISWEVVLVDNASTDGTGSFARQLWQILNGPVPMQLVTEHRQGLAHARKTGIAMARFGFILFCDDDNWLSADYLERIYRVLSSSPVIAACGGRGIARFEGKQPEWFDRFYEAYATGPQPADPFSHKHICLYGAGLAINRKAYELINASGYTNLQTGRQGQALSSSEDIELTNAFVLMGFELRYLNDLVFVHYLPSRRTDREYLTRLFTAFGDDGPIRNLLYAAITPRKTFAWLRFWPGHMILALVRLAKYSLVPPKPGERRLYFTWNKAYLSRLWKIRKDYQEIRQNISRLKRTGRDNRASTSLSESLLISPRALS